MVGFPCAKTFSLISGFVEIKFSENIFNYDLSQKPLSESVLDKRANLN